MKTEFIYYRLRNQVEKKDKRKWFDDDPILAGLKMYYRYSHEAATSNNDGILIPLQIELTNFWLALADENLWKLIEWLHLEDRNFWKPFIEGLLLIHQVWIKEAMGQPYLEDIPILEKGLEDISNFSKDQKAILRALLETWRAMGLGFAQQPDHKNAEKLFGEVIHTTESLDVEDRLTWFKHVVLSLAYRQRAYLHRIHGLFEDAINDFKQSLYYSRSIHFNHEEATLRNDLGFAQMQNGEFLPALENMLDGLQLRYKLAVGPRTALSHSSLAQRSIATGDYEEARKYAQSAVRIANAVGYRRGIGFGNLALAEATRRFAFSAQGPSNQEEFLREAEDAIKFALRNLNEPSRIIDAKLEQACLYRDRIRAESDPAKKKHGSRKQTNNSSGSPTRRKRKESNIGRWMPCAIASGWGILPTIWNMRSKPLKSSNCSSFSNLIGLKMGNSLMAKRRENSQLWSQIGKYFVGRGIVALAKWKKIKKEDLLEEAAHCTMLGLKYSTAFADDHRGLREGRRTLLQELAKLDTDELKRFGGYVLKAEKSEKIVKGKEQSALQNLMRGHALWFAD